MATLVWFSDLSVERVRGTWRDPRNLLIATEDEARLPRRGESVRVVTDSHGQVESSSAKIGSVERFGVDWNIELDELSPFVRDRRTFERYPAEFEVRFKITSDSCDEWTSTVTRNISASGIFVSTAARPQIGEILTLKLMFEGEALNMKGWVVRHDDQFGGLGLEFLEVDPGAYIALAGFLSQLRNAS